MTSYISSFRPVLIALAAVALVECLLPRNTTIYANPFFEVRYLRDEDVTDGCVAAKLRMYRNQHITFLQVGDSSGLTGVKPDVVMRHLPQGVSYVSGGCHASLSYYGYRYMAEVYLRQNKVDYLVLSVNPMALESSRPIDKFEGIAPKVYTAYLSPWRYFYQLPSISWRYNVLNYIYYGQWDIPAKSDKGFYDIEAEQNHYAETFGWDNFLDAHKKMDVPQTMSSCPFQSLYTNGDMVYGKPILASHLEALREVAESQGAKLIILFNPVRCHASVDTQAVQDQVDNFLRSHPDVYAPFPMINVLLDSKDMGDYVHPIESGAIIYSNEIGRKLSELLRNK